MTSSMMYQNLTIGSLIDHAQRFHGNTEIVSVETTGGIVKTNWSEIGSNARRLAAAFDKLGIAHGQRCATIAWNNRRHLEIYFGVSGSGKICHTINPRLSPDNLQFIINDAEDQILFVDYTFKPLVEKIKDQLHSVKHFVLLNGRDQVDDDCGDWLFYDELIAGETPDYLWPDIDETTPSSLCYTSGTTGNPKGVLYTHRSTLLHSLGGNQPDGLNISAKDTVLPVVPMFHVNAWGVPYIAAANGCKLVMPGPNLDGQSLATLISNEKVNLALGVPTIWALLLDALQKGDFDVSCLKRMVVGGSAVPESMITAYGDQFGAEIIHAWGMSETSPLGSVNQPLQKHMVLSDAEMAKVRTSQGRPPFGVDLRLVNDQNDTLEHNGETSGNLQIRGHWIVDTYFSKQSSSLTDDGWFDTGDIATIDEDGFLVIRDRSKDLIKSGGEWISSVAIENLLTGHPQVAQAAVIAARHPKWDERPVAVVVKAEDQNPAESDLLDWLSSRLEKMEVPDKVVFADALPLGGTGKVLKNQLRDSYQDILMQ